jgi:hypothetical protein
MTKERGADSDCGWEDIYKMYGCSTAYDDDPVP